MKKTIMLFALAFFVAACATEAPETPEVPEPSLAELCVEQGGEWLEEYRECEGISEQSCTELDGTFDDCASACRNNPEAEFCTMQCVMVCSFEN